MSTRHRAAPELPAGEGPVRVSSTTIEDYGSLLPVGITVGNVTHRGFSFRRFSMKEERELEEKRKKNKKMSVGDFVAVVLSHMLKTLGPHNDFQAMSEDMRISTITQLCMGDVLYLWLSLRIDAMGEDMKLKLSCPKCSEEFSMTFDLRRTDVKVIESGTLIKKVRLKNGIELPDGSIAHNIEIKPVRWYVMCGARQGSTFSAVRDIMITDSIHKLEDSSINIGAVDLESLSKRDMETLTKAIEEDAPGPEMALEIACTACQQEWQMALNWNWDFFFTAASL